MGHNILICENVFFLNIRQALREHNYNILIVRIVYVCGENFK